ncbi:hypothetical protein SAMN05444287_1066 [Octadecabacter temperatus]|jgi:hypothetical protein|uniref:Uncharacterized protein n=1 Tax=Octadecabacter temperatus TaxID=1458307 RepID=A0A0K0Y506_9RHOB|nr:hypothetical protein [Octadecabacter temperatus]AKS45961.1 hypothetical protein OSB_14090 [Octadecabacter temperatus]SIO04463.1 hypothetical protein SAMN05444287_1066 [Octadecabacter temperatus]
MRILSTLLLVGLTSIANAQEPVLLPTPLTCGGVEPEWSMSLDGSQGEFEYHGASNMTIMLDTPAEGADWPRAFTLIGRGDSAILIVEPNACETGPYTARVLTQRGETPVLLTGCCLFLQG